MDPVAPLAELAAERGIGCHVDACIGGFVLPFLEQLGRPIPPWDFRVPGVTELSVDIHKYGYTPKGASVVLHRDEDWKALQWFLFDAWPAGLYGSPGIAGARPAAPIAIAWAVINHLGQAGYRAIAKTLIEVIDQMRAGVDAIDGIEIVGDPIGPVLAIRATDPALNIYAIADAVDAMGWFLNRNTEPASFHVMLSPVHQSLIQRLLDDMRTAVERNRLAGPSAGSIATEVRYS